MATEKLKQAGPLREPGEIIELPQEVLDIQARLRWFDRQRNKVEAGKALKEWIEEGRQGVPEDVGLITSAPPAPGHDGVRAFVATDDSEDAEPEGS
jgi:hypothetical protein